MRIENLRKTLAGKLIINVSVIVLSMIACFFFDKEIVDLKAKKDWLDNDIKKLKSKIEAITKKDLALSKAIETWELFSDKQRELSGLRITEAKDLIEEYGEEFLLSDIDLVILKPKDALDFGTSDFIKLQVSDVTISFRSINDAFALNFLAKFQHDFPGYVKIKSFNLSKEQEVTPDFLKKIAAGEDASLVKGQINFNWYDMKLESSEDPKDQKNDKEKTDIKSDKKGEVK